MPSLNSPLQIAFGKNVLLFPLTVKVTSQLMYEPCNPVRDREGLEPSSLATRGAPFPRPAHLNHL